MKRKENYAASVKLFAPQALEVRSESESTGLILNHTKKGLLPTSSVALLAVSGIIIATLPGSTIQNAITKKNRSEGGFTEKVQNVQSSLAKSARWAFRISRLFRCSRLDSGEIRDAAPGPRRRLVGQSRGRCIRILSPIFLSGAGGVRPRWASWTHARASWSTRSSQALGKGSELHRGFEEPRRCDDHPGTDLSNREEVWYHGPSAKHRESSVSFEKKTVEQTGSQSTDNEYCICLYEELRKFVVTGTGACSGLAVVLWGGVAAWMRAVDGLELSLQPHADETCKDTASASQDEIIHVIANIVSSTWRNAYAS